MKQRILDLAKECHKNNVGLPQIYADGVGINDIYKFLEAFYEAAYQDGAKDLANEKRITRLMGEIAALQTQLDLVTERTIQDCAREVLSTYDWTDVRRLNVMRDCSDQVLKLLERK